jgi:leader peptidase (prepilin peptidase) / N-methyltransferase
VQLGEPVPGAVVFGGEPAVLVAFVSLVGILVGSFLNVVIGRVPEGRSVVHPPSACPRCDSHIGPRDNIPILSWMLLRAKCRNCSLPISARYPLIEALTGALFGLTAWRVGWTPELPAVLLFVAGGIVLSAIDIEHYRLPNAVVYPLLGLVGGALVVAAGMSSWSRLVWVAAGAVVAAGLLFTIVLLTRGRGMGMGDVRLALVLGAVTGWYGPGRVAVGLFLGFLVGSVVGIGLAVRTGKVKGVKMPFGPSLITGAFIAVLWGGNVWDWYRGLTGL